MSKPKRKRKRPAHGSGQPTTDSTAVLAELDLRAQEIADGDPNTIGPIWGAAHKLLLKAGADTGEAAQIIATRDLDHLRQIIRVLRGEESSPVAQPVDQAPAGADVPPEVLKGAMRAFRKRLKLIRLDHESKLGVGPMTGGRKADIDAIMPPREFPDEAWEVLVVEGKLLRAGPGFYMLADRNETD